MSRSGGSPLRNYARFRRADKTGAAGGVLVSLTCHEVTADVKVGAVGVLEKKVFVVRQQTSRYCTDVDVRRQTSRFYAIGQRNGVTKQTVAGHVYAHYPGHSGS